MPVSAPGSRMYRSISLRAFSPKKKRPLSVPLLLTPMIDILAVLIVYLLRDISPMGDFT